MRSRSKHLVGLDIEPHGLTAAQVAVDGGELTVRRTAFQRLDDGVVRDGEVVDPEALTAALEQLWKAHRGLPRRVRVGVANQKVVTRIVLLPVLTDRKELEAAVRFRAQDEIPMPLDAAVLDWQELDVVDTPDGPRRRVLLVAARRDMVARLVEVLRGANLRCEGIDLAAFALVRAMHRPEHDEGHTLYLSISGLTNLAVAEGTTCLFTRATGGGLEALAVELAERRAITLEDARRVLLDTGLPVAEPAPAREPVPAREPEAGPPSAAPAGVAPATAAGPPSATPASVAPASAAGPPSTAPAGVAPASAAGPPSTAPAGAPEPPPAVTWAAAPEPVVPPAAGGPGAAGPASAPAIAWGDVPDPAARTADADATADVAPLRFTGLSPMDELLDPPTDEVPPAEPPTAELLPQDDPLHEDARAILLSGVRRIAADVRTSMDFHGAQGADARVRRVVLTGTAVAVPGFAGALSDQLNLEVVPFAMPGAGTEAPHVAVAAGLAVTEAAR